MPSEYIDSPICPCTCGRPYRTELAIDLCRARGHKDPPLPTPKPEKGSKKAASVEKGVEIDPYTIEYFSCENCGNRSFRMRGKGHKLDVCLDCKVLRRTIVNQRRAAWEKERRALERKLRDKPCSECRQPFQRETLMGRRAKICQACFDKNK